MHRGMHLHPTTLRLWKLCWETRTKPSVGWKEPIKRDMHISFI